MNDKSKDSPIQADDVAAGAVGATGAGGVAAVVSGLGGAGLAVGGTAVGIPAAVVVGIPAVIGGACAVGIWKLVKLVKRKGRNRTNNG